jgi:ribonuclease HI
MATKKYYAIAVGRQPGIYDNWPEAQEQVKGYPGAVYKGFPTREEAAAWIKDPHLPPAARRNKNKKDAATETTPPRPDEVTIFTDGGSLNNPGPGGYAAIILYNDTCREISGGFALTTNNRMELTACIEALREVKQCSRPITLYSDSSYVVNGINRGWAGNWRKRGWRKADGQPAINPDLWAELLDLVADLNITFKWVRGHAGNPMNEQCDKMAVAAARQQGLPPDPGYLEAQRR